MAEVTKVKASDGTIFDINDADDYTKEEIDVMMVTKADVGLSYTKSEEEALLGQKANASAVETALANKADITSVYTKSETDTLLADKADVGDSYTKAEDDALLAGKADVGSFVGFPDLSNPIYTLQDNDTYTLQHDAWVGGEIVSTGPNSTVQVFADGVMINMAETYQSAFCHTCNFIPLKAGTVITVTGAFHAGKAAKVYSIV